jgi:hypothetical protein
MPRASVRLTWTTPPSVLATEVRRREKALPGAVAAGMSPLAGQIASHMKSTHPWANRTGAAEAGLMAEYGGGGALHWIIAYGTVHYQIYLELGTSKMAPRPVIMPSLQAHYGQVRALMSQIAGR